MKIVSLNIWHSTMGEQLHDYVSAQLASTDVFCLQEAADDDVRDALGELLESGQFQLFKTSKLTNGGDYALRTYVKNGITVVDHATILGDSQVTGLALSVSLLAGDQRVTIVSVHGVPQPGDKLDSEARIEQSAAIIQAMQSIAGPKIICGDFNLMPDNKSVTMFEGSGYRNLIKDFAIDTTRNRLAWEQFPGNEQLFADYAFTSDQVKVDSFNVPKNEASDHLPLEITATFA